MSARILIVEDERVTAEDLRDILTDLGYSVTAAVSNGADAIAQAETEPAGHRLDGHPYPGRDGRHGSGSGTAGALQYSGDLPDGARRQTPPWGGPRTPEPLGYITKPFQEAALHASIEIALHSHREELKAREKEELLASTLRAISEGVISIDRRGTITLFNPAAEAWTGRSSQEALGQPVDKIFQAVAGPSGDKVRKPWEQVLSDGSLQDLPAGAILVSSDGERRPISGSVAPIRDHNGAVAGAVMVFGRASERGVPNRPATYGSAPANNGIQLGILQDDRRVACYETGAHVRARVAQSEVSTVLLEGESGTGKDVLAQFLHYYGRRHEGPFVALNCAAIPETLLESELFGYERGAFTDARAAKAGILEVASSGSIFLDEIAEMPLTVQAKLLRVLEEQCFRRLGGVRDIQVDVRVVAATNRRLSDAIEEGRFRLDLYYRLNVIQVSLPALRERKEDILPLVEHFIHLYNGKFKRNIQGISHTAAAALMSHAWPGNVRELRNVVERAMVLEESERIQSSSLYIDSNGGGPEPFQHGAGGGARSPLSSEPGGSREEPGIEGASESQRQPNARGGYPGHHTRHAALQDEEVQFALVSERVNDVVHADPDSQRRILFRILRIIGPFPGIADIGIKRHGHHDAAFVVHDPAPVRSGTVVAIRGAAPDGPLARNLITVVQVVNGVKDGIGIGNFDHGPVGENQPHGFVEAIPLFGAPKIVQHEKAAAQQVLAEFLDLAIGQLPIPHFAGVEPGPVVNVVAIVQIDGLLDGACRYAGQAAQGEGEMPVGPRIILSPTGAAFQPRGPRAVTVVAPETRVGMLGIHQAREDPFGLLLPILRHLHVVVRFHAAIETPGPLEAIQRQRKRDSRAQTQRSSESHRT